MNGRFTRRRFVKSASTLGGAMFAGLPPGASWGKASAAATAFAGLPKLKGVFLTDAAACAAIAVDHSNLHHGIPAAVLRPAAASDIVTIVRYANQHGLKVAMKGRGHSQYGLAQAAGGIVIDSGSLNHLKAGNAWLDAEPGATWTDVAVLTAPMKMTPPVYLATCLAITVGGTLSVGGMGTNSIHRGAQVDNVIELDVVTGDGRLVTCSREHERELFEMALGGLGQCGIIVRARIPLEAAPARVVLQDLVYNDQRKYLHDQAAAAASGRFDTQRGVLAKGEDGKWAYTMEVGKYRTPTGAPDMKVFTAGMQFDSAKPPSDMSYNDFLYRFEDFNTETMQRLAVQERQYLTFLTPAATTGEFLDYVFTRVGTFNRFSVYPMNTARFGMPLFTMPEVPQVFAVWMFNVAKRGDEKARAAMLAVNREIADKAVALGAKRYAPYCGEMTAQAWREQYGEATWARLANAKKKYDPNNVLTPGPGIFA